MIIFQDREGKKIKYDHNFEFGDVVYHIGDKDLIPLVVIFMVLTPNGVIYKCKGSEDKRGVEYYEIELTNTKPVE